jgi:CDP-diacylglycerol--glycerol-3-phosphate 3-phosphatidyltransferase
MEKNNTFFTFLDRFLDVPEQKVTYLTRPTAIDRIFEKTFLKLIPAWITPNQITKFRLITVPVIAYLFSFDYFIAGTILFLFSAFSDALDGAIARTKHKITSWGTFYDPVADKLLIGSGSVSVVSKYLSFYLALAIVLIEIFLVSSAYFRYKGRVVPAKIMGKTKMVLQCFGVIFLLFYILFGGGWLLILAQYTLYIAIVFALLSLFIFKSI